jgi:transcriptional regulator with XRE-family HTH domain
MGTTIKPFRILVRVKNNRLVRLREELGLKVCEFAKLVGLNASLVCRLENLKIPAWTETGWRPSALAIADYHGMSPEYLWPEEVAKVKKTAFMLEAAVEDVLRFKRPDDELEAKELTAVTKELLEKVTPIERRLIESSTQDDKTNAEMGEQYSLSSSRIAQIKQHGLGKMRAELTKDTPLVGVEWQPRGSFDIACSGVGGRSHVVVGWMGNRVSTRCGIVLTAPTKGERSSLCLSCAAVLEAEERQEAHRVASMAGAR